MPPFDTSFTSVALVRYRGESDGLHRAKLEGNEGGDMMVRLKEWSDMLRGVVFLVLVGVGIPLLLTHALRTVLISGAPGVL